MRINILGVGFDNVTMDEALARGEELLCSEGAHYVVTPNPELGEPCRADAAANAAVNRAPRCRISSGARTAASAAMRACPPRCHTSP